MTVADRVHEFVTRFVVLTEEQADAVTLWVIHSWAFGAAATTPFLVVLSAVWRSGKSRLLEALECLVKEPMLEVDPTPAVLFRSIEAREPTLLLDEVDALFGSDGERTEPLRAMLNAGNRRGGSVARCVPPNWDVKEFSVFCAKCLAGLDNGRWPDTLLDRSIVLRLRRRAQSELVGRFYRAEAEQESAPIREELSAWAEARLEGLAMARPELPEDDLSDRACDAWEPLFAIADDLGGDWPGRARRAAIELHRRQEMMEDSPSVILLRDIRAIFEEAGEDRLRSSDVCARLRAMHDSRWASWGGGGSAGLREGGLARLLRPFEIAPRTIRLNSAPVQGSTAKGYLRSDFEDAWGRYLGDVGDADEQVV